MSGIDSSDNDHDQSDDDDENTNCKNSTDASPRTQRAATLTAREKEIIANMSLDDSLPSQEDDEDEHEFA